MTRTVLERVVYMYNFILKNLEYQNMIKGNNAFILCMHSEVGLRVFFY